MYLTKSNNEIRKEAKALLKGKYFAAISILLASDLIVLAITTLLGSSASMSLAGFAIDYAITFIITVLTSVLTVGQCIFYLNIACGKSYSFQNLFEGLKIYPEKTIFSQLIIQLISGILTIPSLVIGILFILTPDKAVSPYLSVLSLITMAISTVISIMYSQTIYILLDFPETSTIDLLRKSNHLMRGKKWKYFCLQLSFIPWYFFCIITLGIGVLFLIPYQRMCYTLFYLNLFDNEV